MCKVKQARFFSIVANEATDSVNTEQLSINIRFVDEDVNNFFCGTGLIGEAIANNIFNKIDDWQNYYEARHMMVQGQTKGAAAYIASKAIRIYTLCISQT